MKEFNETLSALVIIYFVIIPWLLGFVIAKGVVSTISCIFPFYSWYLVVEFFFNRYMT